MAAHPALPVPFAAARRAPALPASGGGWRILELGRTLDPFVWRLRMQRQGTFRSEVIYRVL